MKKISQQEFVSKCSQKHGNKYDYSQVIYTNRRTKIKIYCKIHNGFFEQLAGDHMYGHGCIVCNINQKSNQTFINESIKVHGEKYDYSKVNYSNSKSKVNIVCKIHGEFSQRASAHLGGQGCPECAFSVYNIETFVKKAKEKYGDKFNYSDSIYLGYSKNINITCQVHNNVFFQSPSNHLINCSGCNECRRQLKKNNNFFEQAKEKHNNFYIYDKSVYLGVAKKIEIICPIHGIFWQIAGNHLHAGNGCPNCKMSHGEKCIEAFLGKNNIKYVAQKTFPNCKNINVLPFDFYIECKNMLIEFQGEQHFPPCRKNSMYGASNPWEEYELIVKRDAIKKEWCEKNGYNLVCISYKNIKKIGLILKKELGLD